LRLDGLAIGDGLTHPVLQVQSHASVAHALGLIDSQEKLRLEALQEEAATLTSNRNGKKPTLPEIVSSNTWRTSQA